jgi:alcohol dehydrogenase class IV
MARMAQAIGLGRGSADDLAEAVRELNARLGLPGGLGAMGVEAADFERIIDGALADHCHKMNPRLASRDDYHSLLDASM